MRSILVLLCLGVSMCAIARRPVRGQANASPTGTEIEIRGSAAVSESCLTAQALSARVAHYSAPNVGSSDLKLVLHIIGVDSAELEILRGDSVLSRRSFTGLPAACADRRDAVALSIALALERSAAAARQLPSAPGVDRGSGAASSGGKDGRSRRSSAGRAVRAEPPRGAADSGADAAGARSNRAQATAGGSNGADALGGTASGGGRDGVLEGELVSAAEGGGPARRSDGTGARDESAAGAVSAATAPANARLSSVRAEEADTAPVILGSLPSTTSRDPRRKGASESSLQLQLGGRIMLEAVPAPVWVAALGVELPASPSFTLGFTALISSVGESTLAGARARARFLGLEAVGCGNIALGVFMLQTCAGAAVALCEVSGRDYPRERPESTLLWAAVLGRATLRWPRAGFIAARLLLQPHVSISRPDLRVENSSEHLQSFWFGGSAGLELWLALP